MSKRILSTILMLIMILNSTVGLAEFTLPASLVELEAEAFDGNTSLTGAVTLPAGITAIGNSAFRGSNLFALRLPEDAAGMDALGLAEDQAIAYLYLEGAETAVADASGACYVFGPSDSAMNTHPAFISSDALVENDGFYYGIQDEKATLLCAVEDLAVPSVVTIPAEVEGYPVAAIGPHAFWQLEQVETIILTCEAVEDETAFVDVPDAEIIRVVQGELTLLPVSSDAQAPFTTGDTVTWTVNAVGGSAPYKYRFAIYFGSTCLEQTSYTTEPAYSYTFLDAGEYNLVVTVRDSNMDSVSLTTDSFVVKNAGADIEITEITPSVASAKVQESVVWTATADKGIGAYRYAFELKDESGERVAYRSYEASNTFTTVIELPGLYSMKVSVLDENNNGNSLVYEGFEVTVDELTIGSIAVDPETPVTGKDITWTVLANGGLQPYSYSFSVGEDSETNESGVFTYAFTDPGDYTLKISVTDANGSVATEEVPVTVQLHPLEITAITVAPEKAQTEDEVVWTVEAIGGSGGYTYAFILLLDDEELDATSYQSENTFAYTLQTAGAYSIQAFVRDGENTTAKMTSDVLNVTLKPLKALDAEMAEPVVEIGMPASIVAKAEGGQKPLRYSFEIYSGEELVKATAYALDDTLSYTADAAGEYAIKLFVRDSAGTVSEVNGSTKLTVYDHLALHGVAAAADTAAVGDRITWTADVVGGKLPLSCNWKILCNGEAAYEVSTESTTIDYAPLTAGEYTVALSVTDAAGTTFEITEGAVTVAEHETVTDASAFTVSNGTITAYTGTDTMVVVPQTIGDVTITGIGANAFKGNKTIESIILPSTVKTVGANAFQNCTALLSADLSGVKTISSSAFAGCTALKTISITKILMEIGSSAFNGCKSLTALNFPELEEGDDPLDYGLNKIGEAAFANCSGIKTVHLANTVTNVETKAFENCIALTEVNYPLSLESEGTGAFYGCVRLTHMEVPEGVTVLASGFLSNAPALKEVVLPSTLTQIANDEDWSAGAFTGCAALESVNLPYGLKSIGNHAFRGCAALSTPVFPKTLQTIGKEAYSGCTSITELNFPELAEGEDSLDYGLSKIGEAAFANCKGIKTVHLANTVTNVETKAFENCVALTEVNYPLSLESEGTGAFYGCVRLTHMEVPEGVTVLASGFLSNAPALKEVVLPSTLTQIANDEDWSAGAFTGCAALESVNLPYGLKSIGSHAFRGCAALSTPVFPKTLQTIGREAYSGCTSFTELNFPELAEGEDPLDYGLKTIREYAFADCSGIKTVYLANTVTNVETKAFENCVALTEVNYPLSLESEGTGAFYGCVRLTHMEVPEGVTVLASGFLSNAPALKEVVLPSTLTQIANDEDWSAGAFTGCAALESVNLPYGLKSIGNHAFRGCTALGWTYVPSTVTSIGRSAFEGFGENLTIESEYGAYAIDYAIENDIPYYYLSLTGHQRPSGTLYLGYPFNLYGYVRGSVNVASVTATLYDGSGTVLQSVTVEPGETDYSLAGTINRTFDFASMALGEYKFSLTGSTALTTEQFYMCDFRIIKEPVSVKTDGFAGPGMYMILEESKPVTGTIQCNYPITAVELAFNYDVVNDDGEITSSGTAKYSDASTGNQKSYDLSKLNASYYTAQNSEVHMKITVVADGQTRVLFEADYIVTDNVSPSGMILDMAKLEAFVNDKANRNFFDNYRFYAGNVVEKYATSEKDKAVLNMYLYQQDGYKEGAFVALLDEIFTGADVGHNEYYVNHYKDEIISFINSVGAEWLDSVGYDEALSYDVQKTIAAYPTLKGDIAKELSNLGVSKQSQQFMSMLIKNIEPLEPLLDCLDAAGEIEEFSELLFHVAMDYTCGQNVLDYLENSYEGADEQHAYYQEAIDELRELYVGDYCARIDKIFDYLQKEAVSMAIEKGEKTIKQIFNTAAEDILGVTFGGEVKLILGIAKILWKTYTDKTGFYQGAEEYTQFMTIYTTYANALYSYQEHFDVVNDGSYTDEELQKLMTSFNVTRLAGIRVMRYLRTIEHIEGNDDYAILQEVRKLGDYKDYFYIAE